MNPILALFDFILHIDVHLGELIAAYGVVIYVILFLIVFIETGVVFMPFLPGDSLLFAAGAFAALGSLNLITVLVLLTTAAILGDTCNYWIGHSFGRKLVENPKVPISKEHLKETEAFFDRHGGKTIILARFAPFVRTFAPFVAGIGKMTYSQFLLYNVVGALAWVFIITLAGFFFGNIPLVKDNFSIIILAIILISVSPIIARIFSKRLKKIYRKA